MKDLFEALKSKLSAGLPPEPRIKTIDLWNNQERFDEKGVQRPFPYNAIFMAFQTQQTRQLALGIKDRVVNIRFYFAIKNYRTDKSPQLDFFKEFNLLMTGYTLGDQAIPLFSPLREVEVEFDEDHELVSLPWIDFQTIYKDFTGYRGLKPNAIGTVTNIPINVTIENGT